MTKSSATKAQNAAGAAGNKKFRLAIVVSHPIEFHVPIYRELTKDPRVDLTVYYCSDWGIKESYDPMFNRMIKWDVPLLEGYRSVFLKNFGVGKQFSFFGQINPGIVRELRNGNYDAVNVFGYVYVTNWLAMLTCMCMGTPIIFRGEADLAKSIGSVKKAVKRVVLTNLFRRVAAFLYTYALNKEFYRFYGVPEEKLFFHPCAVDNNFFQANAKRLKPKARELKQSIGITKPDLPTILFSGTFIPRKRPMDIVVAFQSVADRANLVLMGDGAEREKVEKFVRDKKLPNVYFVGFKNQSEISSFHAIADIFVLPSEYDPSPKVVNEAMNFGVPIITTDKVGTVPDLIQNNRNALIYPVGDVKVLSECMGKLVDNRELRERFGAESLKIVNEWSIERDAQGWVEALEYIYGKQKAQPKNG